VCVCVCVSECVCACVCVVLWTQNLYKPCVCQSIWNKVVFFLLRFVFVVPYFVGTSIKKACNDRDLLNELNTRPLRLELAPSLFS